MTKEIRFIDINQHDELWITVDRFSKEILYENEKWLSPNERIWVKIYKDGFASYGLELQKDPLHGNQKYTWSSRGEVINEVFNLCDTPYELAWWNCAARELCSKYSTPFSRGILLSAAYLHASNNQDKLHYGLNAFKENNRGTYRNSL